jgi:hypothetical protein
VDVEFVNWTNNQIENARLANQLSTAMVFTQIWEYNLWMVRFQSGLVAWSAYHTGRRLLRENFLFAGRVFEVHIVNNVTVPEDIFKTITPAKVTATEVARLGSISLYYHGFLCPNSTGC